MLDGLGSISKKTGGDNVLQYHRGGKLPQPRLTHKPSSVISGGGRDHGVPGGGMQRHSTLAAKMIMVGRVTPNRQAMMREAATVQYARSRNSCRGAITPGHG